MAERIAVIGAGSWGLAVARLLDANDHTVTLWAYDPREFESLNRFREIPDRLPGVKLADSIAITISLTDALRTADLAVLAVPAQYLRSVLRQCGGGIRARSGVVNLAKGIETATLKRMSEVIIEEAGISLQAVSTLSGPSHAEEVAIDMPTTVVVAGEDPDHVVHVQGLFSSQKFRVYTSADLIGVELGGALKNVIAIAAGITDGLGLGDNTKGALITRGLAEITRLGVSLGARPETFAGLSGLGDLVTTCTSRHSRNRFVGEQIGRGKKLHEILLSMTMVAEGIETTRSAYDLARRVGVDVPITAEVYRVLFENKPPTEAIAHLMGRSLKAEVWS
ncbi:glycerol-3-phosphate dehydrogenase [candidate division GN15 bacterium]|uniref:Glycerol-3-phosphate dehydrogenase [NAD(P)+] n=1 Tax=candidate division GN15 bacterium TaxID=2072418 RepID=A0A855X650_9BACT|nr:MAG: glycerol-3-phosphate dehydrogenase [candidate division GN15 bacterium]